MAIENEYEETYDEYITMKQELLDDPKSRVFLSDVGETVVVSQKDTQIRFEKPVYESMSNIERSHFSKMKKLLKEYEFIQEKLLFNPSSGVTADDKWRFNELTRMIISLKETKNKNEQLFQENIRAIEKELDIEQRSLSKLRKKRTDKFHDTVNIQDSLVRNESMAAYVKGANKYGQDVREKLQKYKDLRKFLFTTHTLVVKSPVIKKSGVLKGKQETKEDTRLTQMDERMKTLLKQQASKKKMKPVSPESDKQADIIKAAFKESLKKMVFKTMEECESSKRTKPYYMSKENILKILNDDPRFKKMASKLSKLPKKEICEKIFQ